jgi:hypothetical protein
MTDDATLYAYLDSASQLAGLTLTAETREPVAAQLRVLISMARLFEDIPLQADADPATLLRL